MFIGGAYFLYKDVFDRTPGFQELLSLLRDLEPIDSIYLLCQVNADLRLGKRDRESAGKIQQLLPGALLDDETIARLKERFGAVHTGDRPIFHTPQVLNVLRLVAQRSEGSQKPTVDLSPRYKLGAACLMMNDLLLTAKEEAAIASGQEEDRTRALMTQMLGPFEVLNTGTMTHLIYRSRILFHVLLNNQEIAGRIARECGGFDFSQMFLRIVGLTLSNWLFLVFAFYAYLSQYVSEDGGKHHEFLVIDRSTYRGTSSINAAELDAVLNTLSLSLDAFRQLLNAPRPVDWRYDFVPFKARPLIEIKPGRFVCPDIGFLVEKMHSGVYWAIFEGMTEGERPNLFKAWGILFEEYVNWFLSERNTVTPFLFYPSPEWQDGTECFDGAFIQDSRFIPMEYKGGFLKIEARYSGQSGAFISDLDLKIGAGCEQLARKIEALFNADPSKRKRLKEIPLDHITRVIPVLVVQDQILRGPFINWHLNRRFNEQLDRTELRSSVTVDPLTLIGVTELETMAESAEGGTYDIFYGVQLRCFQDPEMKSELHNFLMTLPGYGHGKSKRIESLLEQQWRDVRKTLFNEEDAAEHGRES